MDVSGDRFFPDRPMKISLINPPIEDFYITGIRRQPLGLLYIAASLREAGYDPSLLNCHTPKKSIMEIPPQFVYLEPYLNNHDPYLRFPFKHYSHYGMSWQEIERRIKSSPADIYFISSLFTTYFEETERVIQIIRKFSGSAYVVAGGYHASLYPEYFINEADADFVICGEGETASVDLVQAVEAGSSLESVPGLVYRNGYNIRRNPAVSKADVSTLPRPARGLLPERDFRAYGRRLVSLITSRGCPNNCSFCTGRIIWGQGRRERPVEDVAGEIRECIEKTGVEIINFEDDNLFPSKERAVRFLEFMIKEREKHPRFPEFTAMNGISIEKLDDEIIELMKHAGFNELNISLVTHSGEIQKKENRPFNSDKFRAAAESAKGNGMNVRGYFILGLPGQDLKEVNDTISFLERIGVKIFPSVYYNIYSSQDEWKMQRSSAFYNENHDLTRDDLLRSFNKCVTGR